MSASRIIFKILHSGSWFVVPPASCASRNTYEAFYDLKSEVIRRMLVYVYFRGSSKTFMSRCVAASSRVNDDDEEEQISVLDEGGLGPT